MKHVAIDLGGRESQDVTTCGHYVPVGTAVRLGRGVTITVVTAHADYSEIVT
jgi:hypothetical protein